MPGQVRSEAYSGVDRRHVLPGSLHCGFRAGEEREPVSEAWEASVLPLNYARSLFLIVLRS